MIREKDIANIVRPYIKKRNLVVDFGCQYGQNLFPFIELNFKELIGLDISSNELEAFRHYILYRNDYKLNNIPIEHERKTINFNDINFRWMDLVKCFSKLYKEFKANYNFTFNRIDGDIRNGNCQLNNVDVSILTNVLHFTKPAEIKETVTRLKSKMSKEGIMICSVKTLEKSIVHEKERFITTDRYLRKNLITFESNPKYHCNNMHTYYLFDEKRINELKGNFKNVITIDIEKNYKELIGSEMFIFSN